MDMLVNIDVESLEAAEAFYCDVFGLKVGRRLGASVVELLGASSPIYLLEKKSGTRASPQADAQRTYLRHWTPVHLDFLVADLDATVAQAVAAGALLEGEIESHIWGRIAHLSDPFGHGVCIMKFLNRGYGEVAV